MGGDDADVISHPVVSFHRGNSFNPFHAHESFLALWTTYLARNLDPCDTGLLLHDAEVEGHLYDFLRRVFAPVHGISRLPAARARPACFRRLVFAVQPRHNFEVPYGSRDQRRAPCGHLQRGRAHREAYAAWLWPRGWQGATQN